MLFKFLFTHKRFTPLFWSQFFGAMNDNFYKNALVILITFKGVEVFGLQSSSLVALASGLFILPYFLFSSLAGQLTDKFTKSSILKATKVWEFVTMSLAALGFYLNSFEFLLFVLFMMGTQSTFFGPAKYSSIPELVEDKDLLKGNSYIEMGSFLAILIGTILGGMASGPQNAYTIISYSVVGLAILGVIASRFIPSLNVRDEKVIIDKNLIRSTSDILKISKKNKGINNCVHGISWFWAMGAAILTLLPVLCKTYLSGSEELMTYFLTLFTLGMGIGSILSEKLSHGKVDIGVIPWSLLGLGIFMIDFAIISKDLSALITNQQLSPKMFLSIEGSFRLSFDLFAMTFFGGVYSVPLYTYLQKFGNSKELSRILAANNIWNAIYMILISVIIMILSSQKVSEINQFIIFGGITVFFSIILYLNISEYVWRFICEFTARLLYNIDVEGLEKFPKDKSVIIVSNHVSYVDWLFIQLLSPLPVRFVIYYKYYNPFYLRFWLAQAKLIPIAGSFENRKTLNNAFGTIHSALKQNKSVIGLFPEGEVSRDGKLSSFKSGIDKILVDSPVTVLPIKLEGLWGSNFSWSGGKLFSNFPKFNKRKVKINIYDPIEANDFSREKLKELYEK